LPRRAASCCTCQSPSRSWTFFSKRQRLWAQLPGRVIRSAPTIDSTPENVGREKAVGHSRAAKSSPASGNSTALQKKKRKPAQQRTKLLVFTKTAYRRAMIGAFTHKAG
jgi:hypothetical protein